MVELPESWGRVIKALVGGVVAWRTPGEVAGALAWEEDATTDVLAALDAEGWLAVWEVEGGPFVTLSPLGADRLGVRLVEVGRDEVARWAPAGDPDPPQSVARHVCSSRRAAEMDFVVDPHPGPAEALEIAERVVQRPGGREESADAPRSAPSISHPAFAYPTLLIGLGLTPWPGPDRPADEPCPACGERPIGPSAYCLCCDRWGLDGRLGGPAVGGRRRPAVSRSRGEDGPPHHGTMANPDEPTRTSPVPGQAERERRKDRRQRKMQARIEAERARRPRRGTDGPPLA